MKNLIMLLVFLSFFFAPQAQAWNPNQPNPFSTNKKEAKLKPNAYGYGVHSNRYGQAVRLRPDGHHAHGEMLKIKPDAYGPGIHMDQYGRPVREVPFR